MDNLCAVVDASRKHKFPVSIYAELRVFPYYTVCKNYPYLQIVYLLT